MYLSDNLTVSICLYVSWRQKYKEKGKAKCQHQIRKYLCKGYGVTQKNGLRRTFLLCYKAEVLWVFPYFLHHSKDFLLGGNVYHSRRREVNIHLHITVAA